MRNCVWTISAMGAACCLLATVFVGCGGGMDDPTSVALRPSKPKLEGEKDDGTNGVGGNGNGGTTPEPSPDEGYGKITGRIILASGDAIPEQKIRFAVGTAPVNKEFCAKDMPIIDKSLLVDPETRGVANVYIYLAEKPDRGKKTAESQSKWPSAEADKLVLDQVNCQYKPHAMLVMVGQEVILKSQDTVVHSVQGKPVRNQSFNDTLDPSNKEGSPKIYTRSEKSPFPIGCATHNWMQAWHFPIDHPYAAVTDSKGNFEISDLPSGSHTFEIWHELGLRADFEVEVEADKTNEVDDLSFGLGEIKG